jgi:hypothetical protein
LIFSAAIFRTEQQLNDRAKDIATLEIAWANYFPNEPAQDRRFLERWLYSHSVDTLLEWFAYASELHATKPFRNVGSWISSRLKEQ